MLDITEFAGRPACNDEISPCPRSSPVTREGIVDAATSKVFANIYPAKWEVPYVAIGTAAFVAYFVLAVLSLFINFGLFIIGAPLLAAVFFVLAVAISAKV